MWDKVLLKEGKKTIQNKDDSNEKSKRIDWIEQYKSILKSDFDLLGNSKEDLERLKRKICIKVFQVEPEDEKRIKSVKANMLKNGEKTRNWFFHLAYLLYKKGEYHVE